MTLDQLRVFIAVADREHLTRAAEVLNLTPSAVSAAIQALEGRYGVHLFDRIGRRIALSAVGRSFLAEAKATHRSAQASELALRELAGLQRGSLAIRASQTIASYWLPPYLVAFKNAHPGIAIILREGNSADVSAAVLDGDADLGLVEGDVAHPALCLVPLARDRLVIVGGPDHPLARAGTVTAAALADASWILRESGSGTRSAFEVSLRHHGIDPTLLRTFLELPTNEAVCVAVRASGHLTVVSNLVALPHIDAGRLARIPFDLPERAFSVVRHEERYRTKASRQFEASLNAAPPRSPTHPT